MKFGFPLAFTATVLSWAILEYGDQMAAVNQLEPAHHSLKWITDFLINAHPEDNVLYIQVNTSVPGTEVAAETAAVMASASLRVLPEVATYYNSTGYGDELLWAASWLYHATGDRFYLEYATGENRKDFASWGSPAWFSWDNKNAGTQVLLSRLSLFGAKGVSGNSGLGNYRKSAECVMCSILPKSPYATSRRTNSNSSFKLRHPVASAFLGALYSDYMLTSQAPKMQPNHIFGSLPNHKGASISTEATTGCTDGFKWLDSTDPNPNVAVWRPRSPLCKSPLQAAAPHKHKLEFFRWTPHLRDWIYWRCVPLLAMVAGLFDFEKLSACHVTPPRRAAEPLHLPSSGMDPWF
ncbi:Endoglucanase 10 [Hibiscus syriacus]|uniref:cellulase n=1 Tax=Hibiscus syriacus TaxID=106335 RepID=A0A6A3B6L2_HIBSY|nr:Endoglucanase 10 [Hibiscus syriacus]